MPGLLFVSQPTLDGWLEAGHADVTAEGLHLDGAPPLALEPALRVVALVEGRDDAGLVGKVRTEAAIRAAGGEPYGDSLLLGDVVYTVEPGFLASVPLEGGMALAPRAVAQAGAEATGPRGSAAPSNVAAARRTPGAP